MAETPEASNSITKIDFRKRCYKGASANGQLQFPNNGLGWSHFSSKTGIYTLLGAPPTLAMGFTECCAEYGRGVVYWMVNADYSMKATLPWTQTTAALPSLLYVDFVWDNASKEEWFKQPHWARLDRLNARAGALDLNALTMPITFNFEMGNLDNIRLIEGLAPITLTYNSSGSTHLGFTAEMTAHMQFADDEQYWQASEEALKQFKMMSGTMVVTQLQGMYNEVRPQSLFFLSPLIKEVIKGHDEWVKNGGYTIEGDKDLRPELAEKVQEAVQKQQISQDRGGDRLQELQYITTSWSAMKRAILQQYFDKMNAGSVKYLSLFMVFDEGWVKGLSQEEKLTALELWKLEDERKRAQLEADGGI